MYPLFSESWFLLFTKSLFVCRVRSLAQVIKMQHESIYQILKLLSIHSLPISLDILILFLQYTHAYMYIRMHIYAHFHRIAESQNGRGGKGPMEAIWSIPCSSRAPSTGCPGLHPGGFDDLQSGRLYKPLGNLFWAFQLRTFRPPITSFKLKHPLQ